VLPPAQESPTLKNYGVGNPYRKAHTPEEIGRIRGGGNEANSSAVMEPSAAMEPNLLFDCIEDPLEIRSRTKHDIFHQFDYLPLGCTCPAKTVIYHLLIDATYIKIDVEYKALSTVLQNKGVVDLVTHECFNREIWRARVQMKTPPGDTHASSSMAVDRSIKNDRVLSQYYTADLAKTFEEFATKCRSGWYEEIADVPIYEYIGQDADGLDLWKRNRGTVRCENYHQKLDSAIGPWAIGACTAHSIMVLRTFLYNVLTGISRCGEPNFGHPYLYFLD
jgi:hypothetical protein